MLSLYGLCYEILPWAQDCLESLLVTASEPLEINIVEGHSKNSDSFLAWGKELLVTNKIKRFVTASGNCKGAGLLKLIRNFPSSEDFFFCTDLDLIVPDGLDWIGLSREGMKQVRCCGFNLSLENYKPPCWGFNPNDSRFGNWLMSIKTEDFQHYTLPAFEDQHVLNNALKFGSIGKFFDAKLYHLGWDGHLPEYGDYWQRKYANHNWQSVEPSIYTLYTKENLEGQIL